MTKHRRCILVGQLLAGSLFTFFSGCTFPESTEAEGKNGTEPVVLRPVHSAQTNGEQVTRVVPILLSSAVFFGKSGNMYPWPNLASRPLEPVYLSMGDELETAIDDNNSLVAMAYGSGTLETYSITSGGRVGGRFLFYPTSYALAFNLFMSPDASKLYVGAENGLFFVYDVYSTTILQSEQLRPGVSDIAVGGQYIALALFDSVVVRQGSQQFVLKINEGVYNPFDEIAISDDGSTLIAGGGSAGTVRFFDLRTRRLVSSIRVGHGAISRLSFQPGSNTLFVAAVDGDGAVVATASRYKTFDLATQMKDVIFNSYGTNVFTAHGTTVEVWDVEAVKRALETAPDPDLSKENQ